MNQSWILSNFQCLMLVVHFSRYFYFSSTCVRQSARGVSKLYAHLVLTVKYRHQIITGGMLERLRQVIQDLCDKWQCECIEVDGEPEHLHLLFRYAPQLQLSKFIGNLKSVSSRRMKQEFNLKALLNK